MTVRRTCFRFLVVLVLFGFSAAPVAAHGGLVSATPAPNSSVRTAPPELHLRFTEAIEVSLASVALADASGKILRLIPRPDPHDVRALVAALPALPAGTFRVAWRVVAADGHATHGIYPFTVSAGVAAAVPSYAPPVQAAPAGVTGSAPAAASAQTPGTGAEEPPQVPLAAMLLRGLAALALMTAAGVLSLAPWAAAPGAAPTARRVGVWLTGAAAVLLLSDTVAWAAYAAGGLHADALPALLATVPGRIAGVRLLLVLLALWAGGFARRTGVAATFAMLAVLGSAALGHAATVHPLLALPVKAAHVVAVAAWIGGVVLLLLSVADRGGAVASAGRVSALALACVVVVGLTGLGLSLLFLTRPADLLHTDYGRLIVLKALGMAALIGIGAAHRGSLIPSLRRGEARPIRRALRLELLVFTLIMLVAGALAYTPLPDEGRPPAASPSK